MLQNCIDPIIWKDFKQRTQNIDKLVQWAQTRENQRICDKYSNISNTVKIMKNLMAQFVKKAESLQKKLLASTHIEQIQSQSKYYEQRINSCLILSEKVKCQMEQKDRNIRQRIIETGDLKRTLMKLKTQNIKIAIKIEEIEANNLTQKQKQNIQIEKQNRLMKQQQDRKMITNGFNKNNLLEMESNQLEMELFNKIDRIKRLRQLIESSFELSREKLRKQEKKSNLYGLAGSMLFKMQLKQDSMLPSIKKSTDSKLLVYHILKQKYQKHTKNQQQKKQKLNIQIQQFIKFTPMQIIGVIELKGGLKSIINKKNALYKHSKYEKSQSYKMVSQKN